MPIAQTAELNCGRLEGRSVELFEAPSETVCFPHARLAGLLRRARDPREPAKPCSYHRVWLLSSDDSLKAEDLLAFKRAYWGIENGLHQRLDGSRLQEDKSRVRHRSSLWNLGQFRRLAVSLGTHWIARQSNPRKATLNGFFDAMADAHGQRVVRIATSRNPSWLP